MALFFFVNHGQLAIATLMAFTTLFSLLYFFKFMVICCRFHVCSNHFILIYHYYLLPTTFLKFNALFTFFFNYYHFSFHLSFGFFSGNFIFNVRLRRFWWRLLNVAYHESQRWNWRQGRVWSLRLSFGQRLPSCLLINVLRNHKPARDELFVDYLVCTIIILNRSLLNGLLFPCWPFLRFLFHHTCFCHLIQ